MMFAPAVVVVVVMLAGLASSAPPAGNKYSSRFDHLDVDAILRNERATQAYIKCILDTGPCTNEGREFRKYLPEALKTSCAKCTEAQKSIMRKTAKFVMEKHPDQWELIRKKYDPKQQYRENFRKFLAAGN